MKKKPYLGIMAVTAFICAIAAFNIDSAWADEKGVNSLLLGLSIAFGLVAVGAGILAAKTPKE